MHSNKNTLKGSEMSRVLNGLDEKFCSNRALKIKVNTEGA